MRLFIVPVLILLAPLGGCTGKTCTAQQDCDFGSYCALVSEAGAIGERTGECTRDCETASECSVSNPNLQIAVCTNEGRCQARGRPPRLVIFEPQGGVALPEGTRTVRIAGEVETAAAEVVVTVRTRTGGGCGGELLDSVRVLNPTPGTYATMPFSVEDYGVDPGETTLDVSAQVGSAVEKQEVSFRVECAGCARINLAAPQDGTSARGLELDVLSGAIEPASVSAAVWRVFSARGGIIDGVMPVASGRFHLTRLPLFPGLNRVEVVVSGVGQGLGEARCGRRVTSTELEERGLRVLLSWDGPTSDLDLHLVGPGGRFGDAATALSLRSPRPFFQGSVHDDPQGFGPEAIRVPDPPDGVYGVVVEPIIDGLDRGADAFVRVLFDGRLLFVGPVGPRHLTALDGRLWAAGTVRVANGAAEWTEVDLDFLAETPPTRPPADWPMLY